MAVISKIRRLVNPGKKRKLSALQKLFFGSKRQRAAVKKNAGKKRKATYSSRVRSAKFRTKALASLAPRKRRKRNISSIVTVWPMGNPGRKRTKRRKTNRGKKIVVINKGAKMATRRRKRTSTVAKRRVHRRRRNYGTKVGRSWSTYKTSKRRRNPGRRRSYKRRNPGVRRSNRRHIRRHRNPGFGLAGGMVGRVLGTIGGSAATSLLMGFVPSQFTQGVLGYLATGVVAIAQGKLIGKISKSQQLGNDFTTGGFVYLAIKVISDFFPSVKSQLGFSGMGLIGGSSFYVPQVNRMGNMGSFVVPSAVTGAIPMAAPAGAQGVGRVRRTGRMM